MKNQGCPEGDSVISELAMRFREPKVGVPPENLSPFQVIQRTMNTWPPCRGMDHNRASQAEGKIQNTATFSSGGERYVAGGTLLELIIINLCAMWADAGSAESHICDRLMMREVARAVGYHRVEGLEYSLHHSIPYSTSVMRRHPMSEHHHIALQQRVPELCFG